MYYIDNYIDEVQMYYAIMLSGPRFKRLITKKKKKEVWLLYDSLKCQNYRDRKQYSGSQGLGVGEGVEYSGVAQGIILVVGTVTVVKLYLSKFMELYTSKRMNFMCPSTFCHTEY